MKGLLVIYQCLLGLPQNKFNLIQFLLCKKVGVEMKINKDFIKFLVLIGSGILVWLLVEYYMSNQI